MRCGGRVGVGSRRSRAPTHGAVHRLASSRFVTARARRIGETMSLGRPLCSPTEGRGWMNHGRPRGEGAKMCEEWRTDGRTGVKEQERAAHQARLGRACEGFAGRSDSTLERHARTAHWIGCWTLGDGFEGALSGEGRWSGIGGSCRIMRCRHARHHRTFVWTWTE